MAAGKQQILALELAPNEQEERDVAMKPVSIKAMRVVLLCLTACGTNAARAQSASTWVDVGPDRAGAGGTATGTFQHVDTRSRVGPGGNIAHGVAIGAGPNGLAMSHSIGVHGGGRGNAHNFNLSVGPGGAHVSRGNVHSSGGNSRVIASGSTSTGNPWNPPGGGSLVTGFGRQTQASTTADTRSMRPPFPPMPRRAMRGPFAGPPGW